MKLCTSTSQQYTLTTQSMHTFNHMLQYNTVEFKKKKKKNLDCFHMASLLMKLPLQDQARLSFSCITNGAEGLFKQRNDLNIKIRNLGS